MDTDKLENIAERLKALSQICLMLTRADPQEDYGPVYQLLYHDLENLSKETEDILERMEDLFE